MSRSRRDVVQPLDADGYQQTVNWTEVGLAAAGAYGATMLPDYGLGSTALTGLGSATGVAAASYLGSGKDFKDVDYQDAAMAGVVGAGMHYAMSMPAITGLLPAGLTGDMLIPFAAGVGNYLYQSYVPKFWRANA